MTKVSVIIPTYGRPDHLERAIDSVLNQSFRDLELIVVDDNNPESEARAETEKILSSRICQDNRVLYLKHPRNLNGAVARNTGIRISKGQYIAFLDSDDEYFLDRIEKCVSVLDDADSCVAGVYTGCEFREGGKTRRRFSGVHSGNFLVETLSTRFMFCTGSNIFVRSGVIRDLDGFDESFSRHQDYEFLVRLFEKYSLIAIPEILVIKNNENVNLPDVRKMIEIKRQYLEKYRSVIDSLDDSSRNYILRSNYIQIAEQAARSREKEISRDYYKRAESICRLTVKETIRRILLSVYGN